jgi:hypothetical protein
MRPTKRRPDSAAAPVLLLLVSVPLVPVQQQLAGGLSILGAVNLIALLGARRRLEAD